MPSSSNQLIIFSAGGVAPPLARLRASFQEKTGIEIKMYNGRPEELVDIIRQGDRCDLLCLGAGFIADSMVMEGLLTESPESMRKVLGWRDLSLLYRRNSTVKPMGFPELMELLKRSLQAKGDTKGDTPLKIGLAASGCLTGVWEMAALRQGHDSVESIIAASPLWAGSCGELINFLISGKADVILGWNTFAGFRDPDIQTLILPEYLQQRRPTIICSPVTCGNPSGVRSFTDFLFDENSRQTYSEMGWTLPGWGVLATFDSATCLMKAEKLLERNELLNQTIPTPRKYSADCGSALLVRGTSLGRVKTVLDDFSGLSGIYAVSLRELL